jgi:organic radical activating enzyme
MQDIKAIVPAKDKWVSLVWQVNDWCNFRCTYCSEWNWAGRNKNDDDIDTIVNTLETIIQTYQDKGYRYFKLYLSGGEPTYWKALLPVVNKFRDMVEWPGSSVGINTNFSRPLHWWEEHHHLFEDVVASYHPEWTKEEKYMQNYKFLQDKKNYLCSRVMMQKENFQQCVDFTQRIKNECDNYIIEYAPVYDALRPSTEPYHYDDPEQLAFIKSHTTDRQQKIEVKKLPNYAWAKVRFEDDSVEPIDTNAIIVEGKNFFEGWTCNIHESLHIHPNGNIQQASCGVGPIVGNIVRGEFNNVLTEGVICPKHHCHCAADFNITKARPEYAQEIQ